MPTPCYLVEHTDRQRVSLRIFGFGPDASTPDRHECPARAGDGRWRYGCEASTDALFTAPFAMRGDGIHENPDDVPRDDPRWPTVCDHCDQPFTHFETWQTNGDAIMRVTAVVPGAALDVGAEATLRDLPGGAIWEARWAERWSAGFDGHAYICRLPDGHDWRIDGEATNCTRPGDRTHRCWLREGAPPFLTVGKHPDALTCSAGAGSIASPGYHGFLHNGVLT